MSSPVLGIDLGTTNSVVAVAEGNKAQVLMDAEGNRLIPSVVSFHPQGDVLVGYPARERRLLDAKNTVYSTKRLIGRPFRSIEVQRAQERFPFQLEEAPNKGVLVRARGETYTLPEISAFVLREVRRVAEAALGAECNRAVITVPANFTELQRSATKAAGKIAGLEVLRILNEPTAAALAYGYGKGSRERIAVYDMGGGTFDVTILELAGDVFEVIATAGDTFLGGDDVDVLVAEKMADAFLAHHRFDPRQDSQAYERLRAAAEWSKCQLSTEDEVHLRVEELAYGDGGVSLDLTFGLSRAALESMVRPLIGRTFDVCEEAMKIAGIRPTQLDNVILVGGSTRMPLVRRMVAEYFGREPLASIDPDLVVAQGAALQGWALRGAAPDAPTSSATAPLGRVALKRVTQEQLQAAKRRSELDAEIAASRPAGPAFAPRDQGIPDEPTRVRKPAADDSWASAGDEATVIRKSPYESPQAIGARAPSQPPPLPAKPPAPPPMPGVVQARAVAIGEVKLKQPGPPAPPTTAPALPPAPPPAPQVRTREPTRPFRAEPEASPPAPLPPAPLPPAPLPPAPLPPAPLPPAPLPPAPPSPPAFPAAPAFAAAPPAYAAPTAPAHPPPAPSPVFPAPATDAVLPMPAFGSAPPPSFGSAPPSIANAFEAPVAPAPPSRPPLLLDVTPHSLGVETVGGYCEHVIKRNAAIPVEQTKVFSTGTDMQQTVLVRVVQGESRRLVDNQPLGEIELSGLRQAARGQVKIGVTFLMDADGTLGVKAKDLDTGREQSIRIQLVGGVSEDEIARMAQRQQQMVGR